MAKPTDRRTLEAPPELIVAMKRLAKQNDRSLNAEIRKAMEAWLRAHGEVVVATEEK